MIKKHTPIKNPLWVIYMFGDKAEEKPKIGGKRN